MPMNTDTSAALNTLPDLGNVHLVPTETLLLLAQDMPRMASGQRRAAMGFAVEDRIAQSLDAVHVITGPALHGPSNWLVVVIGNETLAGLRVSAPPKARLVPDVLVLPVPAAGQWSVWASGARVLVRTADGAGFATRPEVLHAFHLAADRPEIVLYGGGSLGPQFPLLRHEALPATLDPSLQRFDLQPSLQGQGQSMPFARTWRRLATVLACAALGHSAILATDVWALGRLKARAQDDLRQILQGAGYQVEADLEQTINQLLARNSAGTAPQFLPLLTRAYATLADFGGDVSTSDLHYAGDTGSLTLTLQAPDITTLQQIETALGSADLAVVAGVATTGDGMAQQQLTLQGRGP